MDLSLALKGVLIGLSVAAPIGPMSMLTMRRTIDRGLAAGLASGFGIALADATYGAIAAFGLTTLSDALIDHQRIIRVAGGIALLYIAWRILRSARTPVDARPETAAERSASRIVLTMYLLTLSNPTTILSFAAIFGGLGLALGSSFADSALLVVSVFAGSMLWWLGLCGFLTRIRHRLTPAWIARVDLAAGAIIFVMALISLIAGLR
jgi:threonine/homoserine/homoserine lactone efflux protein